ncbi:hypothetical protein [Paraburkholderia tuberum]|uniref:Uncharacterized protein n=1 Tax=Paraburkholderia tuberum TaxID=157910 RepID=A0A1H1DVK7_9BURK|nr:hypothetical protein [Paraburkholderia tuberum]SDQ80515.1 hypothetical protein SAMN05445850_1795 [Paraburkholderia tuberum]
MSDSPDLTLLNRGQLFEDVGVFDIARLRGVEQMPLAGAGYTAAKSKTPTAHRHVPGAWKKLIDKVRQGSKVGGVFGGISAFSV